MISINTVLKNIMPNQTTEEIINNAIISCKQKGWNWVTAGNSYTAIIMAWANVKGTNWYREMLVVDGVPETKTVRTGCTHPENDEELCKKLESFQNI
jgi:hypothetical protein